MKFTDNEDRNEFLYDELCIFKLCDNVYVWYTILSLLLLASTLFLFPVCLLFYVHVKNYINGKTTNERFSRKAQGSFSDDQSGMGTTTYMDGKSESESLMDGGGNNGNSSRGSIVLDDDNGKDMEKGKRSTRHSKRVKSQKRGCMQNVNHMMCNKQIISQREMYEKQVRQNDALSESYREAAQSSSVPSKTTLGRKSVTGAQNNRQ